MPLSRSSQRTQVADRGARSARREPDWITDELIADTISTWQPYYEATLTEQDAIEMLVNVGRLYDLLEADHVHSPSRNTNSREATG